MCLVLITVVRCFWDRNEVVSVLQWRRWPSSPSSISPGCVGLEVAYEAYILARKVLEWSNLQWHSVFKANIPWEKILLKRQSDRSVPTVVYCFLVSLLLGGSHFDGLWCFCHTRVQLYLLHGHLPHWRFFCSKTEMTACVQENKSKHKRLKINAF